VIEKTLGNYEILDKLGEGGMGEVWRARDARLQRMVAIKVLPPEVAGDPMRRARFEQEARAVAALNHANIVAVYDVGESGGQYFMVSELVEGESLRAVIERGPMPVRRTIDTAVQMAEGMAAAHAVGIVHRDLKPENVMISRSGQVKLLDFGLAKQSHAPMGDKTATMALSEPGMVLGTAGYMSPEQVRGEPVDARSDIFSFGSILYEMGTGRRAFHGATSIDSMHAVLNTEPPDLEGDAARLPPALANIARRCLEKRPEQRFQSAADLAFALRAIPITGSTSGVQPVGAAVSRGSAKRRRALVAALVALAAIAAGYFLRPFTSHPGHVTYQRITFRRGYITAARFTPDGRNVVYSAMWDDGTGGVYLAVPGNPESRDLNMPQGDELAAISSKEQLALLSRDGTLAVTSLSGGLMRPQLDGVLAADWAPDGASMAVLRYADGDVRLEYPIGHVLVDGIHWPLDMIRISPDGNRVAFATLAAGSSIQIRVADRDGNRRSLGTVSGQNTSGEASWLAWTPKGDEIWFHSFDTDEPGTVYAIDLKGRRRLALQLPARVKFYDIAADGQALLSTGMSQSGILGAQPGDAKERDLSCLDSSQVVDISDDGSTILANVLGESGGPKGSIYLRKMDGSPPVRVGDGHAWALSPDGKWVSGFVQDSRGLKQMLLMPTGPGEPYETHAPGLQFTAVVGWLAGDQNYLVEGALPHQREQCFAWNAAQGSVRPVCPENKTEPSMLLAPDRTHFLSQSPNGGWAVYPVDGGAARPAPGLGGDEVPIGWRSDNRTLYVIPRAQNRKTIPVSLVDSTTGKRTLWKEIHPARPVLEIHHLAIAPGGAYAYTYIIGTLDLYTAKGLVKNE
jgi:eukaryotic-like serine/threonine-protein kinase